MGDPQKDWASILHFARTGKDYGKTVTNMDAAIYAGDRIDELEAENAKLRDALTLAEQYVDAVGKRRGYK